VRYTISHKTVYEYNNAVSVSHHVIRLKPREFAFQHCSNFQLSSEPVFAVMNAHEDYFGNSVNFITIEGAHRQLAVTSRCEVGVTPRTSLQQEDPPWEHVRELCRQDIGLYRDGTSEFVFSSPFVALAPDFAEYGGVSFPPGRPVLEAGIDLMHRIHQDFQFDAHATTVATPLEQVFQQRSGVCQDFAHLQIACLRALRLPARYVSGYLETTPPPGQARLLGADASHAWVQLWCGDAGWIDLDPTNDLLPGERHITVALGRDFADVSPLRGVLVGSGSHHLSVAVDVTPIREPKPDPSSYANG
jgi:transglutaminase-like putative cysteine protease